ncbi:unnamed protein product [Zymoseptoria tritici ST99CH_1A5]|uniref:Extracellular membrane protein CFEM domain-containing protein n=2 Tax=Zymoseptoria tritici TaxID=1047171 RepID=A0A1X7S931_ZYMT9|nr:unnamed protein product [Zymoseptoria tritici ST99CH_3D7]SMR64516.1 unnamed protein product [Zymoseptoria tritici ST99CH_3D1]SMY29857.1 unnamed protein product [Zymoseptoria tritici ST99CH_1A5]
MKLLLLMTLTIATVQAALQKVVCSHPRGNAASICRSVQGVQVTGGDNCCLSTHKREEYEKKCTDAGGEYLTPGDGRCRI